MRGWNSQTIDWYLRAGEYSQYPDKILAEIIPWLRPHHTVLDIGCGPGLYALAIAPLVRQVLAVDRLADVLATLDSLAKARGLINIRCLESSWPDTKIQEPVDVVISAFSSGKVMNNQDSIAKILALQAEVVFLVAPGQYQPPFEWTKHTDTNHPNALATLNILDQMGVNYDRRDMVIDFGQPVRDIQEATQFLAGFLGISDQEASVHAKAIASVHSQGLYLPNPRNVILITID